MAEPEQAAAEYSERSAVGTALDDAARLRHLVLLAQQGDTDAFSCLLEQHQAALNRFCARLLGNRAAAQDLSQETLLRAYRALPLLEEPARFGGWLHGIALNLARARWRRQAREPLSLEALTRSDDTVAVTQDRGGTPGGGHADGAGLADLIVLGPEEVVAEAERAERVRGAVASLPPALAYTVALHYLHGYSCAEIAEALRIPIATVKTRLFKSRGRLRLALSAEQGSRRTARLNQPKRWKKGSVMVDTTQRTGSEGANAGAERETQPAARKNVVHCSFCLTPHEEVERLIAGPSQVYICNRCIAKCNDILRREGVPV